MQHDHDEAGVVNVEPVRCRGEAQFSKAMCRIFHA